jgi:N6-adenosine-specific RNA methylase IME4
MELPDGQFPVIYADPPWPYGTWSKKGKGRSAEAHYDVMPHQAIRALQVQRWAARDCVLLLWVPTPQLVHMPTIISDWGFTYKTVGFFWAKTYGVTVPPRPCMGLGHWTRGAVELCVLATRGKPHRINADVLDLVIAPRREHSRKPDEMYERIERLVAGPYLELFASSQAEHRDGWTRWIGKDRAPERRWPSNSYPGDER